jgi:hypothetical protein
MSGLDAVPLGGVQVVVYTQRDINGFLISVEKAEREANRAVGVRDPTFKDRNDGHSVSCSQ